MTKEIKEENVYTLNNEIESFIKRFMYKQYNLDTKAKITACFVHCDEPSHYVHCHFIACGYFPYSRSKRISNLRAIYEEKNRLKGK